MKLSSPVFKDHEMIPRKYTCEGQDINPPLHIEDLPEDTKELALIVEDPDSKAGTWRHWSVYNIPVTSEIEEDSIPGVQGINDFGKKDYGGPCPEKGKHRYFFKVFALQHTLALKDGLNKGDLKLALKGHILDSAELVGMYEKKGSE
ncbi:YbhB/YbcL family Raf kinase inhibitor-like protein [candidate division KSB1 bacterium]|nr:YbhB/YbcL family Raf kinase inhibitor-like protein [candidate division KSB1 bacterium]